MAFQLVQITFASGGCIRRALNQTDESTSKVREKYFYFL